MSSSNQVCRDERGRFVHCEPEKGSQGGKDSKADALHARRVEIGHEVASHACRDDHGHFKHCGPGEAPMAGGKELGKESSSGGLGGRASGGHASASQQERDERGHFTGKGK